MRWVLVHTVSNAATSLRPADAQVLSRFRSFQRRRLRHGPQPHIFTTKLKFSQVQVQSYGLSGRGGTVVSPVVRFSPHLSSKMKAAIFAASIVSAAAQDPAGGWLGERRRSATTASRSQLNIN